MSDRRDRHERLIPMDCAPERQPILLHAFGSWSVGQVIDGKVHRIGRRTESGTLFEGWRPLPW